MDFIKYIKKNCVILALMPLSIADCSAQNNAFTYKTLPKRYLPPATVLSGYLKQGNLKVAGGYDLTKSLPSGFVTDGSVDYTDYIQRAVTNNPKVIFPNFPVLINDKGISLISNSVVLFQRRSKIIMTPNSNANYRALAIFNVQNVSVYFPNIQGDRNKHTGTSGEWGMGISIAGSSNIRIFNPRVSDCWGDGIYVGEMKQSCNNIQIYYPVLDNNRRNGLSIVSVNGLKVVHPVVSNSNGTAPMAGIDIEPNSNSDEISNITIDRPVTFNSKYGILVVLLGLPGVNDKQIDVKINNHIDDQSYSAFYYSGFKDSYNGNALAGNITVTNPVWKNNIKSFGHAGLNYKFGPQLTLKNVSIINNQLGTQSSQPDKVVQMKRELINESKISVQ